VKEDDWKYMTSITNHTLFEFIMLNVHVQYFTYLRSDTYSGVNVALKLDICLYL